MDTPRPQPKWSPLVVLAIYLKSVRLVLDEAIEARRLLVRKLGALMEDAHTSHRSTIVQMVGRVGTDESASLRRVRERLARIESPPMCESCHQAVAQWLDQMVAACDVMVDVGRSGDLTRLRETQEHLAESRVDARRFNAEYEQLLATLRKRAEALGKKQAAAKGSGLRRLVRRVRRPPAKR